MGPQHEIIRIETIWALALDPFYFGPTKTRLDCAHHGKRNLVLKGEDVGQLTVVSLGPNVVAGKRVQELARDAQVLPSFAHASFK